MGTKPFRRTNTPVYGHLNSVNCTKSTSLEMAKKISTLRLKLNPSTIARSKLSVQARRFQKQKASATLLLDRRRPSIHLCINSPRSSLIKDKSMTASKRIKRALNGRQPIFRLKSRIITCRRQAVNNKNSASLTTRRTTLSTSTARKRSRARQIPT